MKVNYQYIIIGSGPGAVMAAQTLVEAGKELLMLDVGNTDITYNSLVPDASYNKIRSTDHQQHKYILGNEFEAVPSPEITTGAQLTPSRKHIIEDVNQWCPIKSKNFFPMESLAKGGLGAGWGLGAYVYSAPELKKVGLPLEEMSAAYQKVADRIGISCGNDDISPYIAGNLKNLQPPLTPDNSVAGLLTKYHKKKSTFKRDKIVMGLPSMALLSKDIMDRKASNYTDMDFYTDIRKSAWRPSFTLDDLMKFKNFTYLPRHYASHFEESKGIVKVYAIEMEQEEKVEFVTKTLLMGAGALGTARIALRSLKLESLPILCNPYTYMPAINLSMLGKPLVEQKTSMAQAMMIYDPDESHSNLVSVAFYTYRSLQLMRLIQQSPLNIADNRQIFKWLQSAFVIAGIHHPDEYSSKKTMRLEKSETSKTKDVLHIDFQQTAKEKKDIVVKEKKIRKALKRIGVVPIKRIDPGAGSSIHYGGSLPFSSEDSLGTTDNNGRLHGTSNVYAIDGSSFKYLPAKGITLSIMANAHRIAKHMIDNE